MLRSFVNHEVAAFPAIGKGSTPRPAGRFRRRGRWARGCVQPIRPRWSRPATFAWASPRWKQYGRGSPRNGRRDERQYKPLFLGNVMIHRHACWMLLLWMTDIGSLRSRSQLHKRSTTKVLYGEPITSRPCRGRVRISRVSSFLSLYNHRIPIPAAALGQEGRWRCSRSRRFGKLNS